MPLTTVSVTITPLFQTKKLLHWAVYLLYVLYFKMSCVYFC